MRSLLPVASLMSVLLAASAALAIDTTPFYTWNQSPMVQTFGIPAAERALLLPAGRTEALFGLDMASNFAKDKKGTEQILLDGESYRVALALRHGFSEKFEAGIDIPFIGQGGGVFDSFIEGWHDFFGLPEGGRSDEPRNRLLYRYSREGRDRLMVDDSSMGLGDLRLSAAMQLFREGEENPRAMALRASLKLPTGSSGRLHGSGSVDMALWLTGSDDYRLPVGHATLFGAAGAMAMSDGDVLRSQQNNFVGFGTLGSGWAPTGWIAFKTQLSGHTAFFSGSGLRELSSPALQLLIGGTLAFSGTTSLDIGVSEDIVVNTSPDVALHLALRQRF